MYDRIFLFLRFGVSAWKNPDSVELRPGSYSNYSFRVDSSLEILASSMFGYDDSKKEQVIRIATELALNRFQPYDKIRSIDSPNKENICRVVDGERAMLSGLFQSLSRRMDAF